MLFHLHDRQHGLLPQGGSTGLLIFRNIVQNMDDLLILILLVCLASPLLLLSFTQVPRFVAPKT